MKSLIGTFTNQTPVAFAPRQRSINLINPLRGRASKTMQMETMGVSGTVFAIVDKTSTGVASATWHLYRKARSGKKEDRVEVTRHAALDLWNKPNQFMTQQEFVEIGQQHIDLTGESEWVVGRDPRAAVPLDLWPVRPDRIEPVPSATDFLAGWTYRNPDGDEIPLDLDEVIQIRMPDPLNPYRGMGPIQSVLMDVEGAGLASEYNRNFFHNSAEPGGIIQVETRLQDDEFNEMRDRWNEQHRGVSKAHRIAILEQGKYIPNGYSQKDMQFTELRTLSTEVIREAFGFPKPMLGGVDNVNRANAEAGEYVFARWLVVPRLDRWKGALNNDLLPMFGPGSENLEFDYDTIVPADQAQEAATLTAKTTAAVAMAAAGYDAAQVLEYLGLPNIAFERAVPPIGVGQ